MNQVTECPVCLGKDLKEIHTSTLLYPEGEVADHLGDGHFVRNKILMDDILESREAVEFTFLKCDKCGFIFFTPRPDDDDMMLKYKRGMEIGDVQYREKRRTQQKTHDDLRARVIYDLIKKYHKASAGAVLDLGGARGLNLKYFLDDNECYVIDFEKFDLLDGAEYLCESLDDLDGSQKFDVVLFCHVIEHLVDPVRDMKKLREDMNEGAVLYIETPFGCWDEYKNTHNFITHVNFFSVGSLGYLLEKAGFTVRFVKDMPTIVRRGYFPNLVAIVENNPHQEVKYTQDDLASTLTEKQMCSKHWPLRMNAFQKNLFLDPGLAFNQIKNFINL